jgi:serine/threonine protein kinase
VPGYEILGELGRGGMGVVYQARQLALQRTVALKMILTGAQAGPTYLARFRTEAAVLARLQHPNIVQIYDVGEAAGRPYFVLEFVAGGSLARHLDGTPQPARPAAGLVETLARAVQAAHASGVVHRDLKPANILLVRDASQERPGEERFWEASLTPKITDFGLAKCADAGGEAPGGAARPSRGRSWARPVTWPPSRRRPRASRWARPRTSTPWGPSSTSC